MDKISAVLISGIIILVAVSGIIVYDTWVSDDMNTIEAVSYTHLDVYKRQLLPTACICWR